MSSVNPATSGRLAACGGQSHRRVVRTLAAGLTLAAVGDLGLPAQPAGADSDSPAVAEVRVEMREFSFQPLTFSVTAGQPVRFVVANGGVIPHDFGVAGVYDPPQTGIDPQQTEILTLQFAVPGTYLVYCPVPRHVEAGMRATLRVASADPAIVPAPDSDSSSNAPTASPDSAPGDAADPGPAPPGPDS